MSDRPILVINQDLRSTHYENTKFNTFVTVKLPVSPKQSQSFINMDDTTILIKQINSLFLRIHLPETQFLLRNWFDISYQWGSKLRPFNLAILVLFHDFDVNRLLNIHGLRNKYSLKELSTISILLVSFVNCHKQIEHRNILEVTQNNKHTKSQKKLSE